jgi:hypothetical protein
VILVLLALVAQDATGWAARPVPATVGDTIWIERVVAAPPGWAVRAGRLAPGDVVEPLADPEARRAGGSWRVRYAVVAWATGTLPVAMPTLWRLAPSGAADSIAGDVAVVAVASVLPDSGAAPAPAVAPLSTPTRRVPFALAGLVLGVGTVGGAAAWRRRAPRRETPATDPPLAPLVADERWLAAGEPRAVAARAAATLRAAIARTTPAAHPGLATDECLAVLAAARAGLPLAAIGDMLRALDRIAFASVHGHDVAALAARARALATEVSA